MNWLTFRLTTGALAGLACLILAGFSLFRYRDRIENRIFLFFNLFLGLWNLSDIGMVLAPTPSMALFIDRLSYVFATPVVPCFYYLCIVISNRKIQKTIFDFIVLFVGIFLVLIAFSPWLIADLKTSPTIMEIAGPLFPIFGFYVVVLLGRGLVVLFQSFRPSQGLKRNQLKYALVALIFALLAGLSYLVSIVFPDHFIVPPVYYLFEMVYSLIMAYAIFKHHLMDIRIAVRRVALLIVLYGGLLLICIPGLTFLHSHLFQDFSQFSGILLMEVFAFGVILSVGPFVYAYILRRSSYFREHEMAGLTHELKSPLSNIQSAVDILQSQVEKRKGDDGMSDYVQMIEKNSVRLEKAINELINIFQLPVNTESFQYKRTDLNQLVTELAAEYGDRAKDKNIDLIVKSPKNKAEANIDSEKIRQAISNLVSNGIKYTKSGQVRVEVVDQGKTVKIMVEDSGEGIAAEDLPYVFDRLFQGQTRKNAKGSGVGLAIAKTWVEAHGGEIGVDSAGTGLGSQFWITLPK